MYFEIENTPEHIRQSRRKEIVLQKSPQEEPSLLLAPFSKPPKVVFDNVFIGSTCERDLEVFNPTKQRQQITLEKALPPGLVIHLPGEWLVLEPGERYCLTLKWTPMEPTALRQTIRFTNENRGRYDVIIVLKSTMKTQPKGFKVSPGKMKKNVGKKKSPVSVYKKKSESIYRKCTKTVVQSTYYDSPEHANKENFSDYFMENQSVKCPFQQMNFDISEVFPDKRKTYVVNELQNTYDISFTSNNEKVVPEVQSNILKPRNKQNFQTSATELFQNFSYSPLKATHANTEKLNKGSNCLFNLHSDRVVDEKFDLEVKTKENINETNSVLCIASNHATNIWVSDQQNKVMDLAETPIQNRKVPNTSSPKELNELNNFTMNTELSRISDSSFFPTRCSTERKIVPKPGNETHEYLDELKAELNTDTYFKDSTNTALTFHLNEVDEPRPPNYFMRDQPKMCRQTLFKEYCRDMFENNCPSYPELLLGTSPPRNPAPTPLQSITEESTNFYDSQAIDKTEKHSFTSTFTMNRTFDKESDRILLSAKKQTWSKKSVRAETENWKIPTAPPRKSMKRKANLSVNESLSGKLSRTVDNNSSTQNVSLNLVGNVYSQSTTVDPFQSVSYFYDEEAVHKLEEEFKRWLNYILTPPADLDSNIEQKVDVGKAWLENRNKEVPEAPTKEQVCSAYHNSHRLQRLRRAALTLVRSPEMVQVFQKLSAQIDKELIAIRSDKNLHLDVGLQKVIMELMLSYNPLWLRIGLEAIYRTILPLKSNSDIYGLSAFIIQRMFKNPLSKNKNSNSNAPNMLRPGYMKTIKKCTLKKFFMLVFFLDQAKQKKLISHDPCLFCRNAVCKESREIIIRFTKELVAGIGDITKHLRPIGYVVSHKQTYLDEYKYAVHNIALDIRDGVRITKVLEIILMKNGLLHQLRTPAVSRLQKIHNVQVALNALKEANFIIAGDIAAHDIADGHREKTLSLLWQLIHVFRAPLFERAANVIQSWWKKKYEVIMEKRKAEEMERQKLNAHARIIQIWWRKIQYNRQVEIEMQQLTFATVVFQKNCRMWLCRKRLLQMKKSVLKIEGWYKFVKIVREAKAHLETLKLRRHQLQQEAAALVIQQRYRAQINMKSERKYYLLLRKSCSIIQSRYRALLAMRKQRASFLKMKDAVVVIQRRFRAHRTMRETRNQYLSLRSATLSVQRRFRAQQKMKRDRDQYLKLKTKCIIIQKKYRALLAMRIQRVAFLKIKNAAVVIQRRYRAHRTMREERNKYLSLRSATLSLQRRFRAQQKMKRDRDQYLKLKTKCIIIQQKYRALLAMRIQRVAFLKIKNAAVVIQRRYRAHRTMREERNIYLSLRSATLSLQRRFRAQQKMKRDRDQYLTLKTKCIIIQQKYRALLAIRNEQIALQKIKNAIVVIQRRYRAHRTMREARNQYLSLRSATLSLQRRFRAQQKMKQDRDQYLTLKTKCIIIQQKYRSLLAMRNQREAFLKIKNAAVVIQRRYRAHRTMREARNQYLSLRSASLSLQRRFRAQQKMKQDCDQYLTLKTKCIIIQQKYRSLLAMRNQRVAFLKIKNAAVVIQRRYRAHRTMREARNQYLSLRSATLSLQRRFRAQQKMKRDRDQYLTLKTKCIIIQQKYRALLAMRNQRVAFLKIKNAAVVIQRRYRAHRTMREAKNQYLSLRSATLSLQRRFRAQQKMKQDRDQYLTLKTKCIIIQQKYRALLAMRNQRVAFLKIKNAAVVIQRRYRAHRTMREARNQYLSLRSATLSLQRRFRAQQKMKQDRDQYLTLKTKCIIIQQKYRALLAMRNQRVAFLKIKNSVVVIQRRYRAHRTMIQARNQYLSLRSATLSLQRRFRAQQKMKRDRDQYLTLKTKCIMIQQKYRALIVGRQQRLQFNKKKQAAIKIQNWYRSKKLEAVQMKMYSAAVCIQKNFRCYLAQSRYQNYRNRVLYIQRLWRGKLVTRLLHCEFQQTKRMIISIQSRMKGYLVRKNIHRKKAEFMKMREDRRRHQAATVIQAHYRAYKVRSAPSADDRVKELRRRWKEGALKSTQESLEERNEFIMDVLRYFPDMQSVIRALQDLEYITEVYPILYDNIASTVVNQVYLYMTTINRSVSSIEVLNHAAAFMINLTRHRVTGPKIYAREHIAPIIKFMFKFTNKFELFCRLCTYIWLFSKYDDIKEDLTEFLNIPENQKMLATIKNNIERLTRMSKKRNDTTPQFGKFVSKTGSSANFSMCSTSSVKGDSIVLPALESDYGLHAHYQRYFQDAYQAIVCLINTYNVDIDVHKNNSGRRLSYA